jgi:regulator of chromosome condensation
MLLDSAGKVYSLGRHDYGVLGLGEGVTSEVHVPTLVKGELETQACVDIACGTSVSFAVTNTGEAYSWGMGTNLQLSHSGDDDALVPTKMIGQQLTNRKVVMVSSGGQHTILLAQAKPE